jgi:long-chain fatty acid transport protein
MNHQTTWRLTAAAAVLASGSAWATDGYFPHGYGMKALGMGGVSIAMTDNAFAGANNPAVASFAGNRAELGVNLFMPKRGASREGADPMSGLNGSIESDSRSFLVPEFGYNTQINDRWAGGVTVYGNGGMNTDYPGVPNFLGGMNNKLGIDMMQLIVAPTLSYKVDERHAIGVSPLLVYQRFKASGLDGFAPMSSSPTRLTDQGYDSSTGLGVRLGYVGKPSEQLTWGVSWSPKTKMRKFDKYAGLFAGAGSFDIPENYGMGLAVQATPTVLLAFDYQRINYGGVASIANPSGPMVAPLGDANGPGFGWSNVNVLKLGVQWQMSSQWTLRAGYNKSDNPIQARDVTFNIIAPGVITKHYTLGATYAMSKNSELTFAYMYAPSNSVTGVSMFDAVPFGGDGSGAIKETIRMSQQSLGVQYGWKF